MSEVKRLEALVTSAHQQLAAGPAASRFWGMVEVRGPAECWPWQGRVDIDGDGIVMFQGRERASRRVAYELHHGGEPIGGRLVVGLTCDTRLCHNPAHLRAGPRKEVAQPMDSARRARGERHGRAKLTDEQVADIRANKGKVVAAVLAKKHGVSVGYVYDLWAGRAHATSAAGSEGGAA